MNWNRTTRLVGGIAAVAVLELAAAGGAFAQAKSRDSAAARLRAVEDRQAIEQLLMGDYPRALDASDWAAYAALFAKDGMLVMNGGSTTKTGPAAIQAFFSAFKLPATVASEAACPTPAGAHRTMHVVSNLTLHINGDMATDQAYWETIAVRDCKSMVAGAGHYEDTLKREDGHWRFSKREIFDDLPPRAAAPATAPKP
jgi:3-phenylpropionate/cinnamic acid dioxygenase small subunit